MEPFDKDVRVAIYRLFLEFGRAPVAAEIAPELGVSVLEVERSFRRLHDQHVIVLAPGTPYIWMANPLSALPTPYSTEVDGTRLWANCVWDAFGILAMLGRDGRVSARCADGEGELTVEVRADEALPGQPIVHYAVPAARWWDDIGFN